MPIIKSAIKRMRQTAARHGRNLRTKRSLKSALKVFSGAKTTESLSKTQSELDKAVKKGIVSKNAAARKKSQLARQAKEAGAKVTGKAKATAPKAAAKTPAKKPTAAKKPAAKAPVKKAAPKKAAKSEK